MKMKKNYKNFYLTHIFNKMLVFIFFFIGFFRLYFDYILNSFSIHHLKLLSLIELLFNENRLVKYLIYFNSKKRKFN